MSFKSEKNKPTQIEEENNWRIFTLEAFQSTCSNLVHIQSRTLKKSEIAGVAKYF